VNLAQKSNTPFNGFQQSPFNGNLIFFLSYFSLLLNSYP